MQIIYPFKNISIKFFNQKINFQDLEMLAKRGKCIEIYLKLTKIFDDAVEVPIERIFKLFPIAKHFSL